MRGWLVRAPRGTIRYWLVVVWLVSRLAANRRARAKALAVGLRMGIGWKRPARLDLCVRGRRLKWWVGPKSDLEVMNQIFTHGIYDVEIDPPKAILDVGSHIGASILAFRCSYPEARIVGVEPDPRTFERLRRNTESLDVEVRQLAVAPKPGRVGFVLADEPWGSKVGGSDVLVDAVTLDSLVAELRPDLLKLDVEGMELQVLRRLDGVRVVVGEIHGPPAALREHLRDFDVRLQGPGENAEFIATRARSITP